MMDFIKFILGDKIILLGIFCMVFGVSILLTSNRIAMSALREVEASLESRDKSAKVLGLVWDEKDKKYYVIK